MTTIFSKHFQCISINHGPWIDDWRVLAGAGRQHPETAQLSPTFEGAPICSFRPSGDIFAWMSLEVFYPYGSCHRVILQCQTADKSPIKAAPGRRAKIFYRRPRSCRKMLIKISQRQTVLDTVQSVLLLLLLSA